MNHPLPTTAVAICLALALADPAMARGDAPLRPPQPPERPLDLDLTPFPEQIEWGVPDPGDELEPLLFEPDLGRAAIAAITRSSLGKRRTEIPVNVIRDGLADTGRDRFGWSNVERAVGLRFGADIFSISTRMTAPAAEAANRTATIDWRLGRPVANDGPGFIWSISTGGRGGVATNPEQDAQLMLGYRYRMFDHLTLTSQVSMAGNYVFVQDDGWHSKMTSEVKLSADLAALVKLPFDASLDVSLARQVPLTASDFETRGTAMLRFKYTLD